MKHKLLLLLLFVGISLTVMAIEQYKFTHVNGGDGLSNSHVKSIIQDSYGYIWLGTRNGLNRYDGTSMRQYECYDKQSGRGNQVFSALFEDAQRRLWVGTDNGVYIYDPEADSFTSFDAATERGEQIKGQWIEDILADKAGNIWIVAPNLGVYRYHVADANLHRYILVPGSDKSKYFPQCICIDADGTVWIGTCQAGLFRYSPEKDSFSAYAADALKDDFIFSLCDYGDELIIGAHENELKRFDKKTATVTVFDAPQVHRKVIRCVACYDDNLWVGTQNGIYVINEKRHSMEHIPSDPGSDYGLSDAVVDKIYRDREGGIWACTQFGGASYLPARTLHFNVYQPSSSPGSVSGRRISELAEDEQGRIWVSTQDGGVCYRDKKTGHFIAIPESPDRQNVLSLFASGGLVGAGYFKGGIDLIAYDIGKPVASGKVPSAALGEVRSLTSDRLGLSEGSVYALHRDRKGIIWLGDGWNIFRSPDGGRTFEKLLPFGYAYMRDILDDRNGNIWVATMGNGVFCYQPETGNLDNYKHIEGDSTSIGTNEVTGISEDSYGRLWFSTDRGGLSCFSPDKGTFRTYTKADGLPDNVTYKAVEDRRHRMWFGTDKGLVCLDPANDSIHVFTHNDGLPDNQFNYKSALAAADGTLWMGTINGLVSFNPSAVTPNAFIPPVYVTRMYVQGSEVPLSQEIVLPYNRAHLSFDFAALSYTSPQANRYAYQMKGIDKDWIYTNRTRSASYAQLPPGNYLFAVRGSNNDGVWNPQEATVSIRILPPWWRTGWAYLTYFLLLAISVYLYLSAYRLREVRKVREQQLLTELARERASHRSKETLLATVATVAGDAAIAKDATAATYGGHTAQGTAMNKADDQLMSALIAKVRSNLSDGTYNVEALSADMNMSRSSLHRKIKSLTDLTPVDFIRIIRLKRAAELLHDGELRINEICDEVGFQSPSYFAKQFQRQFGMTPTEYAKSSKVG